jgi:hypothetical protein
MDDRDCKRGPEHYVGHPPDCTSRSIRYRLDPPSHGHRDGAGYRDDEPGPIAGRLVAHEQAVERTLRVYDPLHGDGSFPRPDQDDARDRFVMVEEPPLVGADDNGAPVYSVLDRRNNRKHFFSECQSAVEEYTAARNKEERERLDAEAAWEMAVVEALADDPDHTTAGPDTPKGQDEPTPAEALGEPPVPPVELPPDLGDDGRRLVLAELLEHEADRLQRDGTLGPVSAWYLAHLMREAGGFARLTGAATLDQMFDRAEAMTGSR